MLGPAITAIKAYVVTNLGGVLLDFTPLDSPFVSGSLGGVWPFRWENDTFPNGSFDPPVTDTGAPASFIEAEIIGGRNAIESFSAPGNRVFVHPGIIRFYICVPQGTGIDQAILAADTLAATMERAEFGQSGGQLVRTGDFSTYDDVASYEDGNRFVLMASVPFEFFYTN